MQLLDYQQIYADLDPLWWTASPFEGQMAYFTDIYFTDPIGNVGHVPSWGTTSQTGDDLTQYIEYLRGEVARQLVGHTTGGLTNQRPSAYQVFPIYFR